MNLLNSKSKNARTNFCMIQKWGYSASFSKASWIFKHRSPASGKMSSFWHAKIALVSSVCMSLWIPRDYGILTLC